jgi:hypothetical protein
MDRPPREFAKMEAGLGAALIHVKAALRESHIVLLVPKVIAEAHHE